MVLHFLSLLTSWICVWKVLSSSCERVRRQVIFTLKRTILLMYFIFQTSGNIAVIIKMYWTNVVDTKPTPKLREEKLFVAVLKNPNYFLQFRFLLLTSYASCSGFSSDFWKVTVSVPTFDKLRFRLRFPLLPFYKEKSFIKLIEKCERKKCKMKEIKYTIYLDCVCENFCDSILLR